MRMPRLPMQLGLFAAILALAGPAQSWPFRNVAYALDNKDGTLAVFTCTAATGGQCYLKVGVAAGEARSLSVKVGEAVQLPVSGSANALCYSADPDIGWPSCLDSGFHLDLTQKASSTGSQYYYDSSKQ
jgi:hypothetical protein